MTNISFNLSGQIDSCLINVLRVVKEEADSLGLPFFVVGATARDILPNTVTPNVRHVGLQIWISG
jgi:hypothetical protein